MILRDLIMSWQEGVAVTVVLLGLGAGAFLVAQRPSFWIEFGSRLGMAMLLLAWRYVSRRMLPEEEAAWRQAERRGQGDEWLRKQRLKKKESLEPPAADRGSKKLRYAGSRAARLYIRDRSPPEPIRSADGRDLTTESDGNMTPSPPS